MKRLACLVMAATIFSATVPAMAAEPTKAQKDECLLVSRNCKNAVDDIQTQIAKIDKEIKKGTAVYTPQELKKLEQKLTEVKELLRDLQRH